MFAGARRVLGIFGKELWTLAREAGGEAIGKRISERVVATITHDPRAEILVDLYALPLAQTENLRRRHREAGLRENRFVTLLGKIPKGDRATLLPLFDRLPDPDFEQVLDWLEHNPLQQTLERVWAKVRPFVQLAIDPRAEAAVVPIRDFTDNTLRPFRDRMRAWAQRR